MEVLYAAGIDCQGVKSSGGFDGHVGCWVVDDSLATCLHMIEIGIRTGSVRVSPAFKRKIHFSGVAREKTC